MTAGRILPLALLAAVAAALVVSGLKPYDRLTWFMEVAPVLIGIPVLLAARTRFPLTGLLYVLLALHALVLIVGGAYTYARVPVGFWVQDWLQLARNPYDKLGHFMQGFVPAILAREILLRLAVLRRGGWLNFLVVCVCLAVSAVYEMIEWAAGISMGQGADAFLGTQGDSWDTQSDMFLALLGALAALVALSAWHDRALRAISQNRPARP